MLRTAGGVGGDALFALRFWNASDAAATRPTEFAMAGLDAYKVIAHPYHSASQVFQEHRMHVPHSQTGYSSHCYSVRRASTPTKSSSPSPQG